MRVKFLRDEQYESEGRNQGPRFAAGEVYDFTEEFGQRWLQRGAVEVIDADKEVGQNNFKPVTKVHVEPAPEAVTPVAPPPPNPPVEGPTLSPKTEAAEEPAPAPAPAARPAAPAAKPAHHTPRRS